ncbi:MAG: DUF4097 domain-containing protein [Phycisphaerales bacterium]|nr:DUF4097 domain-containing protein [Phycisphaerales bacterium]MCI0674952.1 DUF4097 domain-containing protein [Phycisphaerales bacterium]
MRHHSIPRTLLILLLLAGGCSLNPNEWANRSEADDPIMLEVAGPVAIDVESFNGDVIIESDPKLERAKVSVVREGVHGHDRAKEAEASLKAIEYTVQIVPGELGQVVQVRTRTSDPEPHFQRAHVHIELPDIDGVRVRTSNGKVYAKHVRGVIDISTSQDDVRVLTTQALNRPVTIINRDGDIDFRVRAESTGRFDAQTVNGRVTDVVRYGTMNIESLGDDLLRGTLNDGTNPITLRTANGDIRIAIVPDPEHVGPKIMP